MKFLISFLCLSMAAGQPDVFAQTVQFGSGSTYPSTYGGGFTSSTTGIQDPYGGGYGGNGYGGAYTTTSGIVGVAHPFGDNHSPASHVDYYSVNSASAYGTTGYGGYGTMSTSHYAPHGDMHSPYPHYGAGSVTAGYGYGYPPQGGMGYGYPPQGGMGYGYPGAYPPPPQGGGYPGTYPPPPQGGGYPGAYPPPPQGGGYPGAYPPPPQGGGYPGGYPQYPPQAVPYYGAYREALAEKDTILETSFWDKVEEELEEDETTVAEIEEVETVVYSRGDK